MTSPIRPQYHWMSPRSLSIVDAKKSTPALNEYDGARKFLKHQIVKSVKKERELWWISKFREMEKVSITGNSRVPYQLIRSTGLGKQRRLPVPSAAVQFPMGMSDSLQNLPVFKPDSFSRFVPLSQCAQNRVTLKLDESGRPRWTPHHVENLSESTAHTQKYSQNPAAYASKRAERSTDYQ
ncbi:hypothetical protein T265_04791 [Opisthorchis viverrini]|uniref:Uncharacterized protein n=1 Tax=Opisthorchis viverrini TaxID=6198 RepID=A0A074ZMK2_OPIVI|nr:hypothetical protein T265_04791 [Opisthorchis viverrini]KER28331.1 hypothetical protein T265_04791 [Opisthorchis viverrini]